MDRLWRTGAACLTGLWQGAGACEVSVVSSGIEEDPENDWKGVDVLSRVAILAA
jgi:hypothetical protein